ncbi:MAG: thioredoxin domain-containing protein, partial [Bacteroidia bacterium]|nr:thioredoxin domain-containing protein [Bacteroidia bacterium]
PYLLQHAHNPVDWYPWGAAALSKAKEEDKMILISIGYSACHWCHVMEHESFEDVEVAKIMNENYICIKVDREERPDIDQIYMNAVQLMSGRGGWPLNCFTLPDGRPIYGGTYFPKNTWKELLIGLQDSYKKDRAKFEEYATKLTEGIKQSELLTIQDVPNEFQVDSLQSALEFWKRNIDNVEGGPDKAPKFPLPNNYQFLLRYATLTNDKELLDHVHLTLKKMAYGGIYDQIGGGFARYSTDKLWKVPHFEKMLYDNAQLVSLYSEAYQAKPDKIYKHIVEQTLTFIERELTSPEGLFYSALDADSEGEEGKFYVWTKEELKKILEDDYKYCEAYYNVGKKGYWEHDNNILLRDQDDKVVAQKLSVSLDELQSKISLINSRLLEERSTRERPGLDDKSLTSWNGLMISAYCDAYMVFGDKDYLQKARKAILFIGSDVISDDERLLHSYKKGIAKLDGFLEDYCFIIEAYIKLYQATFERAYLEQANFLMKRVLAEFYDENSGMFYFTSNSSESLIARKHEVLDNVIPGSNSSIARSLNLLSLYFDNKEFAMLSRQMLANVNTQFDRYPSGYSNWMQLYLEIGLPFYEIAIVGEEANSAKTNFANTYIPNKLFVGSETESDLPLLENKFIEGETMYYVCIDRTCKLPVTDFKEALEQIRF